MPAKVTVRLTDDDYRAIKSHADSAGVSVSAYCTAAILRTAKLKTMRVEKPAQPSRAWAVKRAEGVARKKTESFLLVPLLCASRLLSCKHS